MKKIYFLVLAFCFFNGLLAQVITIPDSKFKAILIEANSSNTIAKDINGNAIKIDSNNNSEIEVSEALNVYKLDTSGKSTIESVQNLSGIEYFSNLIELNCSGFYNQNLDVSMLTNLEVLICNETHQMKTLNVSGLTKLKFLNSSHCVNLTALNVSGLTNLEYLDCGELTMNSINLSGLTKLTELKCYWNNFTNLDLTGLINLKKVDCNRGQLETLVLSGLTKLEYLDCSDNHLTNLNVTELTSLEYFNFEVNKLSSIDVSSLSNLKRLQFLGNFLTDIDVLNCSNLEYLDCSVNPINILDVSNLTKLNYLDCSGSSESDLVFLDVTGCINLVELDCSGNRLTSLDFGILPSLKTLKCAANPYVYDLNTSNYLNLENLYCGGPSIYVLDVTKSVHLKTLFCTSSKIEFLDLSPLKELENLDIRWNDSLAYLLLKNGKAPSYYEFGGIPHLNLKYLCVEEEDIKEYQQKLIQNDITNCEINTYCNFIPGKAYYAISGTNKFDFNNMGCTTNNKLYPNIKYQITNGTNSGNFFSTNNGSYAIAVQEGAVSIKPIIENPVYFTVTPAFANVNFPTQTSPFVQDFCISSNGTHQDLEIVLIPLESARSGFNAEYKIVYRNKGNIVQSGAVNLSFNDAVLDLLISNPLVSSQNSNKLTWNFINLEPFESREITLTIKVNGPMDTPPIINGLVLNYTATIVAPGTDEIPIDNTFVYNQTVVGSFDPNDKTCLEGDIITPSLIGEYVHYLIRFENTGTYEAQNIVVKDMIDMSKFDISTLIPTSSSHSFVTKISEGNKVEFIFENINLPFDDANNDGYVAFKIKTQPILQVGDSFTNDANIYFDYNFPILTNKATSTFQTTLDTPDFEFSNYFTLYPNPASDVLNINAVQAIEIQSLAIYDVLGQLVIAVPNAKSVSNIDVSKLRTGTYFIKVKSDKGSSSMKFIKK